MLVATARQRGVVVACCERALAAGVRPGMPLGDAGALLPRGGARVLDAAPRREWAALRKLAVVMQRFSPVVAVDDPDGLLLDISGCVHLFGDEARMRDRVVRAFERRGCRSRVAVASTVGCARAVSRFGPDDSLIVPEGREAEAIAPLPLDALQFSEDARQGLAEVSIERIGQLAGLPRSALPSRFGDEVLYRLDEALGRAVEFIDPVRTVEPVRAERVFEGPTTRLDAVELATQRVIGELVPALSTRGCGVTRLDLTYARSDLPPEPLSVSLTHPSRDPKHLWTLVRPRLERLNMGFGVCGVSALAARTGPLRHEQEPMVGIAPEGGARHDSLFAELLDTLTNRCGADRVCRVERVGSHAPERAFRYVPVLDAAALPSAKDTEPPTETATLIRPTVLFDRPVAVNVVALTPDGPVSRITWDGDERSIVKCVGPERIECEWWRKGASDTPPPTVAARDYFKVQDERGRWLWVFRDFRSAAWFVHGVWA